MKSPINWLLTGLLVLVLFFVLSCSESTGPELGNPHAFPEPIDSVATDIMLLVYSPKILFFDPPMIFFDSGLGDPIDTIELDTESPVVIDYDSSYYFIYAVSRGFYTELYRCGNGDTIDVDLDAVPQIPNSVTGVILAYPYGSYFSERPIALSIPGGASIISATDKQGRFGFSNLSIGTYLLHLADCNLKPHSFEVTNTSATHYYDFSFDEEVYHIEAPNIYLYPEITTNVKVELEFPMGGEIAKSEPPYGSGWDVIVTPDGIIDGQYKYLFYEVLMSVPLNQQTGWLLDGSDLENEFRNLLSGLGFIGREIDDFIEYWAPKVEGAPWCAVYPQDADAIITLGISPRPDKVLRALFLIKPLTHQISIPALPYQKAFTREGFTVVEWGGILGPLE